MSRLEAVYFAKLAEQAERWDDMAEFIKVAVASTPDPSLDERNLLSVAYKNTIGARRASWRVLSQVETRERQRGRARQTALVVAARVKLEHELTDLCKDILRLLAERLVPTALSIESRIFYSKMIGDYYRYLAEFSTGADLDECATKAEEAYAEAAVQADENLRATHPMRLGVALNQSVFQYDVRKDPARACEIAKASFDGALAELDSLSEEGYRDSTLIMQLLRDNLQLWAAELQETETETA
ncbi:14-3-3 protein-like protein [Exidia glandulosa HHB12029]|uniref:14-3-3 protein-like protein n=1 Tax=Exidia glandulosa HHB12029 TaxID=1314781 RepID=A0A165E9G4_EXIGL|nr:14-3-3 protein-like protein [Exidia glandulosa HHB12029]